MFVIALNLIVVFVVVVGQNNIHQSNHWYNQPSVGGSYYRVDNATIGRDSEIITLRSVR